MASTTATESNPLLVAQEEEPVMFTNPCLDHASLAARLEAGYTGFSDDDSSADDLESDSDNEMQHGNWLGHMSKGPAKKRNPKAAKRCLRWLLAAAVFAAAGAAAGVVLVPRYFPGAVPAKESGDKKNPEQPAAVAAPPAKPAGGSNNTKFLPPAPPSADAPSGEKSSCLCNSLVIGGSLAAVGGAVAAAVLCGGKEEKSQHREHQMQQQKQNPRVILRNWWHERVHWQVEGGHQPNWNHRPRDQEWTDMSSEQDAAINSAAFAHSNSEAVISHRDVQTGETKYWSVMGLQHVKKTVDIDCRYGRAYLDGHDLYRPQNQFYIWHVKQVPIVNGLKDFTRERRVRAIVRRQNPKMDEVEA